MDPRPLLAAIRAACSPGTWSRGVELSRAGAVLGLAERNGEVELRVTAAPGQPSPLVVLYPEDEDWSCECNSQEGACVHVAAAIIALSRARSEGKALPAPEVTVHRVGYKLERTAPGLSLVRLLLREEGEVPLSVSLHAAGQTARLATTELDLEIEAVLGSRTGGVLPKELWTRLWPHLRRLDAVALGDRKVRFGPPTSGLWCVVEDCAEGVRLRLEQHPELEEIFPNGIVRIADTLHMIDEPGLTGREIEELRRGLVVPKSELSRLVSERLPELEKKVPLEITATLPRGVEAPPRLVISVEPAPGGVSLLATLVYGRPPVARLDGEHLAHLGGGALPLRDRRVEQVLVKRVRQAAGLELGVRRDVPRIEISEALGALGGFEVVSARGVPLQLAQGLVPALRFSGEAGMTLDFAVEEGKQRVTAGAVLAAFERGEPMLVLDDGLFAPLPWSWLEQHAALVADLLRARDERGDLSASAAPDVRRLCRVLDVPPPPRFEKLAERLESFSAIPEAPLPPDLTATLRTYQRRGVDWLSFMRDTGLGALLADDMGLGKTLQALAVVPKKSLVVAPTSVLHNWAAEAARFRPGLSVSLYHGPNRALGEADLTITSYALLRLDADKLAERPWSAVVLDEAQNIKNPDSQVARAACRLRADWRLLLSGTPIENRLEELWSLMRFQSPGYLGSRESFSEQVVRPMAAGDAAAAARLQQRLRPFILRRKKQEVAPELPPRTEVVIRCELDAGERAVYDAVRATTQAGVVEKLRTGGSVVEALEALLRLRQAACHAGLVPGQEAERSSKVELLVETLDEVVSEGHKALVFSQWTSLLDRVEPHLRTAGLGFLRLDGSTRDRAAVVSGFQADSGPPVLLISLKAGGAGLNLTAADHVFLLDPWWNPAVEDQAADRAHRIGQTKPVIIQRLIAAETVEERILGLQAQKRATAAAALEEGGAAVGMTREDLLGLLA